MTGFRWLHLSDFHVGKDDYGTRKIFQYIHEHVAAKPRPNFIFITGDIAHSGLAEQYQTFQQECLEPLKTIVGSECQFFLVPGNHDVDRSQAKFVNRNDIWSSKHTFFEPTRKGLDDRRSILPRFQGYLKHIDNSQWLGLEQGFLTWSGEIHGVSIGIVGVNTAWLSFDDSDKEKISPGKSLLEDGLETVRTCQIKIVIGHHPIDWFHPDERQSIQALLKKHHVIYLHGHMHRSGVTESGILNFQVGAGFQAREHEFWKNRLSWGEVNFTTSQVMMRPYVWARDFQKWVLDSEAIDPDYKQTGQDCYVFDLPEKINAPTTTPVVKTELVQRLNLNLSVVLLELSPSFVAFCASILETFAKIEAVDSIPSPSAFHLKVTRKKGGYCVALCWQNSSISVKNIKGIKRKFDQAYEGRKNPPSGVFLFVAANLSTEKHRKALEKCRQIFRSCDLLFKVFTPRDIEKKLAPYPMLVAQYFKPATAWQEKICGQVLSETPSPCAEQQLIEVQAQLSQVTKAYTSKELEEIKQEHRRGKPFSALKKIKALIDDDKCWRQLDVTTQAQALCIHANLLFYDPETRAEASEVIERAQSLDSAVVPTERRLLLVWLREGPKQVLSSNALDDEPLLKASALIALGRYNEAEEILNEDLAAVDRSEYLRLSAFIRLSHHDASGARALIEQALVLSPNSMNLLEAQGVLLFYQVLCPAKIPTYLMDTPMPVDWFLIRKDEIAVQCVRQAESIFMRLLEHYEAHSETIVMWQVWRLACLACDGEKIEVAGEYCRALITKDFTHPYAIAWALARNFLSDPLIKQCRRALEKRLVKTPMDSSAVLNLGLIHVHTGNQQPLKRFLNQYQTKFTDLGKDDLWQVWMNIAQGNAHKDQLAELSDNERLAQAKLALAGNLPAEALVELCFWFSDHAQRAFLLEHAVAIIERIATAEMVHLVVDACYQQQQYAQVLKLIEAHHAIFPDGPLSSQLRRFKLSAKHALGRLPEAITEAQALALQTQEVRDQLNVARLLAAKGDQIGAIRTVRLVRHDHELPADEALRFSHLAASSDPEFARTLLADVLEHNIDPDHLWHAQTLAGRLGMSEVSESLLHQQLVDGQGRNYLVLNSVDDLLKFIDQRNEEQETLWSSYQDGDMPIHFYAEYKGQFSLPQFFWQLLRGQKQDYTTKLKPALFVRHGKYAVMPIFPDEPSDIQLYLDITALLMATHLNILDMVEACFQPLFISTEIPGYLIQSKPVLRSEPHLNDILLLVEEGNLTTGISTHVSDAFKITNENIADWVEYFHAEGFLSEEIQQRLPQPGQVASTWDKSVKHGDTILLDLYAVTTFAVAQALESICQHFVIVINDHVLARVRLDVKQMEQEKSDVRLIDRLLERISSGIDAGTYQLLPTTLNNTAAKPDVFSVMGVESLFDSTQKNSIVWCDDRWMSGRANCVTVSEMLRALVHYGVMTEKDQFKSLLKLRQARVAFIPAEKQEILHYLSNVSARNGVIIETPELSTIRRYFALCIGPNSKLQMPDETTETQQLGELPFLVQYYRLLIEVIFSIWECENDSPDRKIAKSNWVVENLFIEFYPNQTDFFATQAKYIDYLAGYYITFCMPPFMYSFRREPQDARLLQEIYFDWFYRTLLRQRLSANPGLLHALCSAFEVLVFRDIMDPEIDKLGKDDPQVEKLQRYKRLVTDSLPPPIRDRLYQSSYGRSSLQMVKDMRLPVGKHIFEYELFNDVVTKACASGLPQKIVADNKVEFSISIEKHPEDIGKTAILLTSDSIQWTKLTGVQTGAFLPTVEERFQFFKSQNHELDLPAKIVDETLLPLAECTDPFDRYEQICHRLEDSTIRYYQILRENMKRDGAIGIDALEPPSGDSILRYYRLDQTSDVKNCFEQVAEQLLAEVGIIQTLQRLSHFPCPLPKSVYQHLAQLSDNQRDEVIASWNTHVFAPLSFFHFARVALHFNSNDKATGDLLNGFLATPSLMTLMRTFVALLKWAEHFFAQWQESAHWSYGLRLTMAWGHASHILSAMMKTGVVSEKIETFFEVQGNQNTFIVQFKETQPGIDVACARVLSARRLIVLGLGYAVGDRSDLFTVDAKATIHDLAINTNEDDVEIPVAEFMADFGLLENRLGTFLQEESAEVLQRLGQQGKIIDLYHNTSLRAFSIQSMQEPNGVEWLKMLNIFRFYMPFEVAEGPFRQRVMETDFVEFWLESPESALTLLEFLAEVVSKTKQQELVEHIHSQTLALAKYQRQHTNRGEKTDLISWSLVASMWYLSLVEVGVLKRSERLGTLMLELADHFPAVVPHARQIIQRLCNDVSGECAQVLWPSLLVLKSVE